MSRYFEGGLPARWFAAAIVPRCWMAWQSRAGERVDRRGEREIRLGDAALAVRGQRQAQLVPAVDEDVRMVVGGLGGVAHSVGERHRRGEVGDLDVAHDRVAVLAPRATCDPAGDLVGRERAHDRESTIHGVRIVSLVPHATELLFALGLGDDVVGVTHECDYPPRARELPQVTSDELPPGLSSAEIDAAVRERTERGDSIYRLDEQILQELEPDLIVTQELCPVCAVSYDEVQAIAKGCPSARR